jgi:5,6-dimethylbenzimidazole synthase
MELLESVLEKERWAKRRSVDECVFDNRWPTAEHQAEEVGPNSR